MGVHLFKIISKQLNRSETDFDLIFNKNDSTIFNIDDFLSKYNPAFATTIFQGFTFER